MVLNFLLPEFFMREFIMGGIYNVIELCINVVLFKNDGICVEL